MIQKMLSGNKKKLKCCISLETRIPIPDIGTEPLNQIPDHTRENFVFFFYPKKCAENKTRSIVVLTFQINFQ